ncbi:MAG: sugar ABC transporter permease [Paenibacillaceae bacterium]|nr:sugar ABC transporter permease [Paenibacillaceae bacterium]
MTREPDGSLFAKIKRDRYFLLLLLPGILYYALFKFAPMFGILIAFKNYHIFTGFWASEWVGLKYFRMFFDNPDAFVIIRNTFLLGVYRILFGFPAPIVLALLLNEVRLRAFKKTVQTITYLPHFISTVVVTGMTALFLSPVNGIVNEALGLFGVEPIAFLQQADWFRTVYVSTEIWQEIGWGSIIYLAALTTIDPHLYEAAGMDGAGRWRQMLYITLPGITPAIVILFILRIGQVMESGFEKVFLLYNPATYEKADILATYVYRAGLVENNYSYGSTIDLFMGVIGLVFVVTANAISRKVGETSLW